MLQTPRPLDRSQTVTWTTPDHWRPYLGPDEQQQVTFLPLAQGAERHWPAGWCTYADHLGDSPDIEILCGGMNAKLPTAAAVWRQGHLLHFGFQQGPDQLNANGRALLENCIVYVARFTADRPIARTPSPFVDAQYPRPLRYLRGALQRETSTADSLASQFAPPWSERLAAMTLAELRAWVAANQGWLCAGAAGKLTVDEDAAALEIALGGADFCDRITAALDDPGRCARALSLLARRVPDGPGAGDAGAWRAFLTANRAYLFFLEEGGYRWHLDPMARARGVPCRDLRGPARADLPEQPPLLAEWNAEARVHAAASRIVRGILHVDPDAVAAARTGGGYVDVRIEVRETVHGPVAAEVTFRHFVHTDSDRSPVPVPDADGLLALQGQDRIAFLVTVEGAHHLADDYHGRGIVDPARDLIIRVRKREMLHREMLAGELRLDPRRKSQVRELLGDLCQDVTIQRATFAVLEQLGDAAAVEIIAAMDDRRALPERSLTLTNKAADRFEAARHYGPHQAVDGIAAVLNQITGESFGSLYNGAADRERDLAVRTWTLYAHYRQAAEDPGRGR